MGGLLNAIQMNAKWNGFTKLQTDWNRNLKPLVIKPQTGNLERLIKSGHK